LGRASERLLREEPSPDEDLALAAAAIWQLEQDQRTAFAAAPGAERESAWAQAGRMAALRRSR
jgi:hypothetical protein